MNMLGAWHWTPCNIYKLNMKETGGIENNKRCSFSFQIFNVFIVYIFAKIAGGVNLFSYYHLTPAS